MTADPYSFYPSQVSASRPDILAVIRERVDLRRVGHEFVGLCPFHDDRHPSLHVNPDKQLFLCRACQTGGDVFTFIMMIDGLTFPQAKAVLGVGSERKPRTPLTTSRKRAAQRAAAWANEQRSKLNTMIAERMEQRDLADEANDFELAEIFDREIIMLRGFFDALEYPRGAAELLTVRASIEKITDGAEVAI